MSARYKDANECLQAGLSAEQMLGILLTPEVITPPKLKSPRDLAQEIKDKIHPQGKDQLGLTLPWGNRNGSSLPFRFRPGEVTVWTGYNKHGKSEVLNHVIVDLCWQGEKALIASLEVQGPETFRKLLRMVHGRRELYPFDQEEKFDQEILPTLDGKVWVFDHVGSAPLEEVLNTMLYAYQRYGVTQFVLDSLMRFDGLDGEGQSIWNNQRAFMDELIKFAQGYGVHVHLVAHSKKPERGAESRIPRRYDIMGSAYISNLAFNIIVVWRNRDKQDALEEVWQACEDEWEKRYPGRRQPQWKRLMGKLPSAGTELAELYKDMISIVETGISGEHKATFVNRVQEHDSYFIVDAQRGGDGDCPARYLWFDYDSLQFLESCPAGAPPNKPGTAPIPYALKEPAYEEEL